MTTTASSAIEIPEPPEDIEPVGGRRRSPGAGLGALLRGLAGDKFALTAAIFLLLLTVVVVFAPVFAPYSPAAQSVADRLQPPVWLSGGDWSHPLGTDNLGRDVLSRIIFGGRISLIVGVAVVIIAGAVGVGLGLLAGYKGGRIDVFIMRVADTQMAFPGVLLALTILAAVGPSAKTVIIVLALNSWMLYTRMTRSVVLSVKEMPYVEAAEVAGCKQRRVVLRHILPNLLSPVFAISVLEFARVILTEATLSFLGVGIQPPQTSWGLDIAIGKDFVYSAWWLVTFPGIAIACTVLSVNVVASWFRVQTDEEEQEKQFAARSVKSGE